MDEQLRRIALSDFEEKMRGMTGLKLQKLQGELQLGLEQSAQANAQEQQLVQGQGQGQGFNAAQGGSPNQMMSPQMTQTQQP